MNDAPARLQTQVRIVGAGLLGSSLGLALRAKGVDVVIASQSDRSVALAQQLGAGRPASPHDTPGLIVVCVPPDITADIIERELNDFPEAIVTDVASVKMAPLVALVHRGVNIHRYIGSHPMAGRERGGVLSARGDLFVGRPWVITKDANTNPDALALVEALAHDVESVVFEMSPEEHDEAVGLVSHVPQIVSSLMAKQLTDAPERAVRLAGQGVRDVTRIAASQPDLWIQILSANRDAVLSVLDQLHLDIETFATALRDTDAPGAREVIERELVAGNTGVARLPGKHGQNAKFQTVTVLLDDRPGQLAQLLTEIGELGINLEDLRLEHAEGALLGLVEFSVLPEAATTLSDELTKREWRVVL